MIQGHLVYFLSQPKNRPILKTALVSLTGDLILETKSWVLDVLVAVIVFT